MKNSEAIHRTPSQKDLSNATMPFMKQTLFTVISLCLPFLAFAQGMAPKSAGFEIMTNRQSGNCMACHDLPGVSGFTSNFAPPLQGVGSKWTIAELTQWVSDARKINPNTLIPPFGTTQGLTKVISDRAVLSPDQISQVVETLISWR
jgi:sulfur-oxidizing protein SoxX